jgi:hypothetical protein
MQKLESFNLYGELIESGTFIGKYTELVYMLDLMESSGRLSYEQCETLLALARASEPGQPDA